MAEHSAFARERRERILEEIRNQGSVRTTELAQRMRVTEVTVRRDINSLADQGLVMRVHGGAILRGPADRALPDPGTRASHPTRARFTVGMVTPSMDYYWPQVVRGVQAAVTRRHSRLVLRGSSYSADDDRTQVSRLIASGIDGLLLVPMLHLDNGADTLRWIESLDLPVVLLERTVPAGVFSPTIEWVTTDQQFAASLGVRHLASRGHRRIGLLASQSSPHAAKLTDGWYTTCRELGLDMDEVPCEDAPRFDTPDRDQRLDEILARTMSSGTTALMVHADREAIALLQRAQDVGISVPGDLAVLAYDDEMAGYSDPPLSAVRPAKHAVGRDGADMLLSRLEDPSRPVHRLSICPDLVVRGSCGPHISRT